MLSFRLKKQTSTNVADTTFKLYYVVYGLTTLSIANLICLANITTPNLNIPPRVEPLCQFCCWSTGLTKRKLPMQCAISVAVYAEEAWKPSLHVIALTGGPVAYSIYHSSSFFK